MGPVCTIMVGRLDDWLKVWRRRKYYDRSRLSGVGRRGGVQEGVPDLPGTWLSPAAFLGGVSQPHALERIHGGDVVISPPYTWQVRFNASDIKVSPRIDTPVAGRVVDELYGKFTEFRRAYDEDGLTVDEFDAYGATGGLFASSAPPAPTLTP